MGVAPWSKSRWAVNAWPKSTASLNSFCSDLRDLLWEAPCRAQQSIATTNNCFMTRDKGAELGVALWPRRLHGAVRPHGSLASAIYSKECVALPNGSQRRAARYLQAVKRAPGVRPSDSIDLGRAEAPLFCLRGATYAGRRPAFVDTTAINISGGRPSV